MILSFWSFWSFNFKHPYRGGVIELDHFYDNIIHNLHWILHQKILSSSSFSGRDSVLTVCLPWTIFCIFVFYVLTVLLLKGMGECFILSKDEPLTPSIDVVMALWIFRRRAQNTKIGRKLAKIGPLDPSFFFVLAPSSVRAQIFSGRALGAKGLPEKIWTSWAFQKPEK